MILAVKKLMQLEDKFMYQYMSLGLLKSAMQKSLLWTVILDLPKPRKSMFLIWFCILFEDIYGDV